MTLKCLLKDEEGVVRERSANVLGIIARKIDRDVHACYLGFRGRSSSHYFNISEHSLHGRQAFLDLDMVIALSKLVITLSYHRNN